MPRWPAKDELNAAEQTIGQDKQVVLPADGSIREALDELKSIDVVHTDALAFMEEKVTVMIHEDTDVNAENPVQIACNGINQFFFRGQPQEVKRKYVAILAGAKRTRISTPEITDASGARTNAVRQASSLRYPFSVMHDPNPRGGAWLKNALSEAA